MASLSPTFLLTAGHCLTVDSKSITISITTLPTVYASTKSKGKIPSKDLILHPDYFNSTTQLVESDIGIIYLSESIFFDHEYQSCPCSSKSCSEQT